MKQLSHRTILTHSANETCQVARELSVEISRGSVIALYGQLGSGKTTFTQGFAGGLGVDKSVKSPTFTLMHHYHLPDGGGVLHHLDLYRVQSVNDLKSFDLKELFKDPANIIIIEWPEKIESLLPPHTIKIYFETVSENIREITIQNQK